jgi:hypothetical protein
VTIDYILETKTTAKIIAQVESELDIPDPPKAKGVEFLESGTFTDNSEGGIQHRP